MEVELNGGEEEGEEKEEEEKKYSNVLNEKL